MRLIGIYLILILTSCSGNIPLEKWQNNNSKNFSIISAIAPVTQATENTCGLAALTCVLNYWDISSGQEKLFELFPPENHYLGYSISELKDIANNSSVDAFLFKGDIGFLKQQVLKGRPIILPIWKSDSWELRVGEMRILGGAYNHYVVVYGFSKNEILVMDPDEGAVFIPNRRLEKMWDVNKNTALLIAKLE